MFLFSPKTTVLGNGFSFLLNFFLFPKRKKFSCSPYNTNHSPSKAAAMEQRDTGAQQRMNLPKDIFTP